MLLQSAATVSFTLTSTLTRTLAIASGNNQTGATGTAVTNPLVVLAQDNGVNLTLTAADGRNISLAADTTAAKFGLGATQGVAGNFVNDGAGAGALADGLSIVSTVVRRTS